MGGATTRAAAIKTMAANAPTDPQTPLGIRGIAPSVYPRPGMCCRRDVDSRSGDEWGLSWELAVGGVPWRRPKAPPLSLPPPGRSRCHQGNFNLSQWQNATDAAATTTAPAIKTMAAKLNAPTNPQTLPGVTVGSTLADDQYTQVSTNLGQ